jgi:transposase
MDQGSSPDELWRRLSALERRTDELTMHVAQKDALLAQKDAIIVERQALISVQQEQITALEASLERAGEQLTLLKKALFAPRRERYLADPDQQLLFESLPLETKAAESTPPTPSEEPPPAKPRRQPRRKFVFPQFLPVRREDHPLPTAELPCGSCGRPRVIIRTHVTRQLELEPAKGYIIEHVRHTYACSCCRQGSQVVTTAKPPAPIEKSPFGASVLAWITSAKFERHLPTYRHQEIKREWRNWQTRQT